VCERIAYAPLFGLRAVSLCFYTTFGITPLILGLEFLVFVTTFFNSRVFRFILESFKFKGKPANFSAEFLYCTELQKLRTAAGNCIDDLAANMNFIS
jgi:hypothetical protein